MAKPFAVPDPPGPGGGGASSSGAGPPAGANQGGPQAGYQQAPNHQHQHPQPPQSAPPIAVHGSGGAFPMVGPTGAHVPSTPIPVTGGHNHYYHHYGHHHPQPVYHQPQVPNSPQAHFYYPGPYHGSPYPVHPLGAASPGTNAAEPMQHPPPHTMTPSNATFAHPHHQGPANGELVQALYEALHRCGVRESPPTPLSRSPPSASCSPPATGGFCAPPQTFFPRTPASAPPVGPPSGGRLFFPPSAPGPAGQFPTPAPSQPTPLSATSHSSSSGISSSLDTPSCSSGTPHYVQSQAQPVLFHWQDDGDSSESESGGSSSSLGPSSSSSSSSSGCSPYCFGLDESESSSAGSLTPSSAGPSGVTTGGGGGGGGGRGSVPPHLDTYMARRELLQEFPGKIPQRKRRTRTPKSKKPTRFLEKPLMWQMAVTAALIALGCGYFAGR